jgi:signal transduction histidine kinase
VLHTLGLGPALDWLGEEIARIYGVNVRVKYAICPNGMAEEIQALLYRSARELLINIAKHAGVRDASLAYSCIGGQLTLVISDAGCGFEPADHFGEWRGHKSFGLRSIYERITNFGGRMVVVSSPGKGTTVTLTIPCANLAKERCDGSHYSG